MIGDGEPHGAVGEIFDRFAVEFWSVKPLAITSGGSRSAIVCGDFQYRISAEVVFVTENRAAVVIDFGAIVALGNVQPDVSVGDSVTGDISIGLPLCIEPIPHHLITRMGCQWQVDRISTDLPPYADGRREVTKITYREETSTEETKAFDYVLHCKELGPSTVPNLPDSSGGF